MHASHVRSQHSFELPLSMTGMHITQSEHAHGPSITSWSSQCLYIYIYIYIYIYTVEDTYQSG